MLPEDLVERCTRLGARAVLKWGLAAQLAQLAEEASELAVAASKLRRERIAPPEVLEELVDVLVVGIGVLMHLDPRMARRVVAMMHAKLDRLEDRLDSGLKKEVGDG